MPFNLSEDIVDSLLHKLGSDDAFREQFVASPRQALASLGFAPAADDSVQQGIWMCMCVTELASKEAIQASRDGIRQRLIAQKSTFNPHSLQVELHQVKRVA